MRAALAMIVSIALGSLGLAAAPGTAVIVNSGSTNRAGFRITVNSSGEAEFVSAPRRPGQGGQAKPGRRKIPGAETDRFFADLKAAQPLSSLPAVHCMKSASFGSKLTVSAAGEESPDLSCGARGNAAMENLIRDVNAIIALFQGG